MEDIINALLDVVRAQHSATEGTDEAPFNMDDIVDMAMNLLGRPDEKAEEEEMVNTIQKTVESLAPDIFPPKTFEEMDNSEKVLSASNMIESAFMRGNTRSSNSASSYGQNSSSDSGNPSSYGRQDSTAGSQEAMSSYDLSSAQSSYEEEEASEDTGNLNDIIYKSFMDMMGLSTPQVEYPFDRSQIVYGKEKSITEQLAEEEEEKRRAEQEEAERNRKLSAWELAQNAIDSDEAAHAKESYTPPQPVEPPTAKSASQMAAEAIRKAEEEDRMKLEIEKQAEAMMEAARKRGQDPMAFMLHQQEILQYMEKNSDELVSFEDYEDLSPEEKLEIERQIHIEHQIAEGVDPSQVDQNVPEEYIPMELRQNPTGAKTEEGKESEESAPADTSVAFSTFDEDTLRALSMQVLSENSDMILSENADEDMAGLQEQLFENLKRVMAGSGTAVPQENVASLLSQAAANQMAAVDEEVEEADPASSQPAYEDRSADSSVNSGYGAAGSARAAVPEESIASGMSAVEMARAAQEARRAAQPQQPEHTMSAVELAKAAQAAAKPAPTQEEESKEESLDDLDLSFDELDDMFAEEDSEKASETTSEIASEKASETASGKASEAVKNEAPSEVAENPSASVAEEKTVSRPSEETESLSEEDVIVSSTEDEEEEYEYVDADEIVLGEHTQAEIDEALENLSSLGLEGEVYERAKRMILLELAGSETALEAWLLEQENSKKKKANVSALDEDDSDDLSDFDEDLFEKELEEAIDEDFEEQVSEGMGVPVPESGEDFIEERTEDTDEDSEQAEAGESPTEAGEIAEPELTDPCGSIGDGEQIKSSCETKIAEDGKEIIVDSLAETVLEEISEEAEEAAEKAEINEKKNKLHRSMKGRKGVVHKKEKSTPKKEAEPREERSAGNAEERGYQVSLHKPFVLKNSTSFMNKLEDYITENQENRRLSTGFKKLDGLLRYGLHKGSYFIDSRPQYLKNAFMQQMADRAAESGVDVLYISTELSRYDLMVETISRLSYEMNGHDSDKAHSVMAIMTGEDGATLGSLADELNWYRGRISEHLFIVDQESVDEFVDSMDGVSAGAILEELIRSIVREGAHKPVVFIDNIENILSVEDSEDMKPLMEGIRQLAKELSIPILISYGYAQAENEEELSVSEIEFRESLGQMSDVHLELAYADMITEDSVELTVEDIREMAEDGDQLLINVMIHKNRRPMRASCQIQATPKFNYFEE